MTDELKFEKISREAHRFYAPAMHIYRTSFPVFEQRDNSLQLKIMQDSDYLFYAVVLGEELVGLLMCWEMSNLMYVEHFAISDKIRGQNLGTRTLQTLKQSTKKPIILEIDPPVDEVSKKRRHFYERLGFEMFDIEHMHPAFVAGNPDYPLKIMACPGIDKTQYDEYNDYLHNHIIAKKGELH